MLEKQFIVETYQNYERFIDAANRAKARAS